MDEKFLIDTNIAIYFLEGLLPDYSLPFSRLVFSKEINLSVITQIELLGWAFPAEKQAAVAETFVSRATLYSLNERVVAETIQLRKAHKIKLPDAIIAATALVNGLTLVSRNDKDFKQIPALAYRNPFSLNP